ncbi:MAG TPA: CpaD family pilus assembly lipoprotein [Brevundimonas sp.]|jgi:pilus assembly protein CpaD|uniref:CpaD family pilus assembly lipoprotein n=1 Tax=Brevundimonas sp. TaxID=1871086 RepID=UPI002C08C41D|nr:CpaD family pilus assembly lipoprotein [Brevundimonas sp.]HRH20723.1 CpaD family pilus assembly lipoprotein [Brevundimonas sp.]
MKISPVIVLLAVGSTVLAGCGTPASGLGPEPLTPLSRWQLRVEPQMDQIALAVHDNGLSAAQRTALAGLALRARQDQTAEIVVEAPSGEDPAALQMAWAAAEALRPSGTPVRISAYAAPDPRAPIVVGYARLQAVTYDCSRQWGSLTRHADNGPAQGLGCATISNMAAQIADPRDILGQRPMAPSDASRRTVVIQHYRQGQPTATQSTDSGPQLSDAIS